MDLLIYFLNSGQVFCRILAADFSSYWPELCQKFTIKPITGNQMTHQDSTLELERGPAYSAVIVCAEKGRGQN